MLPGEQAGVGYSSTDESTTSLVLQDWRAGCLCSTRGQSHPPSHRGTPFSLGVSKVSVLPLGGSQCCRHMAGPVHAQQGQGCDGSRVCWGVLCVSISECPQPGTGTWTLFLWSLPFPCSPWLGGRDSSPALSSPASKSGLCPCGFSLCFP